MDSVIKVLEFMEVSVCSLFLTHVVLIDFVQMETQVEFELEIIIPIGASTVGKNDQVGTKIHLEI